LCFYHGCGTKGGARQGRGRCPERGAEGEIREREEKAEAQPQERDMVRSEGSCTVYKLGID
jgi:hypothetical protein